MSSEWQRENDCYSYQRRVSLNNSSKESTNFQKEKNVTSLHGHHHGICIRNNLRMNLFIGI